MKRGPFAKPKNTSEGTIYPDSEVELPHSSTLTATLESPRFNRRDRTPIT
jgi:hypothetical protein